MTEKYRHQIQFYRLMNINPINYYSRTKKLNVLKPENNEIQLYK